MKKIIAILLTLAMLLSGITLLASCDKSAPDDGSSDKENTDNTGDTGNTDTDGTGDAGDTDSSDNTGDAGNTGDTGSTDTDSGENSDVKEEDPAEDKEEIVSEPDPEVEMISYNIAFYEATSENMTVYYEGQEIADYTIEKRAKRLNALVEYYAPDVLALQEVNWKWWTYIISNEDSIINTYGYDWAGNLSAFRNKDGFKSSDNDLYNLLLWDSEKFEEIKSGVFRLSPAGHGANNSRMCTYAILKNRTTGVEILYASTHLCTRGNASTKALNLEQAQKLTEKLIELAEGRMMIVGGDFNADGASDTYRHMTSTARFSDARTAARVRHTPGVSSTRMWGMDKNWNSGNRTPIDHIFYRGKATAVVEEWAILSETYDKENNVTTDKSMIGVNFDLSDHQGVYIKIREKIS